MGAWQHCWLIKIKMLEAKQQAEIYSIQWLGPAPDESRKGLPLEKDNSWIPCPFKIIEVKSQIKNQSCAASLEFCMTKASAVKGSWCRKENFKKDGGWLRSKDPGCCSSPTVGTATGKIMDGTELKPPIPGAGKKVEGQQDQLSGDGHGSPS